MADPTKIQELCIKAADGDMKAVAGIRDELSGLRDGEIGLADATTSKVLRESLELVCEAIEKTDTVSRDFFIQSARIGFDSLLLRDRLADCAREAFADYLDPAGMLFALGIQNQGAPAIEIPVKWAVFEAMTEGVHCVHPLHGCGTVADIDGLSNEVRVEGVREQVFPLSLFLDSFHVLKPGSVVAGVLDKDVQYSAVAAEGLEAVRTAFRESLLPSTDGVDVIKATLVPTLISDKEFAELSGAKTKKKKAPAAVPKPPIESENGDKGEDNGNVKLISKARSLEELCVYIQSGDSGAFDEAAIENCRSLLATGAIKSSAVNDFGRTLIMIWNAVDGADWLVNMLREFSDTAIIWTDADSFGEFTNRLLAAKAEAWLKVTFATLPRDQAVQLVLRLPLKNLNMAQRVMISLGEDDSALVDGALERLRSGGASADLILWLWQRQKKKCEDIRDPLLVMRTLGIDVRGPYLKANRDLKKMVIGNEIFQKFLMGDGDPVMVKRMVGAVRQYTEVLESGERQSLLVRLARLYPQVKEAIETRTRSQRQSRSRKQSKVTSYRSYVERQKELQDILTVKIPENSRAIAHARSYGDLRENAEYKAAKEEQGHLSTRRSEIEKELNEVQPTDFSDVVNPDVIVPGITVTLTDDASGTETVYHVVGLWDGDPEASMLSYGTPLGQELLGKTVGDGVEMPDGSTATVQSISGLPEELRSELGRADE